MLPFSVNNILLKPSYVLSFMHCLRLLLCHNPTESIWFTKAKILTIFPFREEICFRLLTQSIQILSFLDFVLWPSHSLVSPEYHSFHFLRKVPRVTIVIPVLFQIKNGVFQVNSILLRLSKCWFRSILLLPHSRSGRLHEEVIDYPSWYPQAFP